jgi:NADH:ubiquinone oxidoreductase subunit F (NADH-binding)/NADH:ubiquinone oxidoreductase subunit E/NAD-dependent dihydropyrimidine dehydrogenase PreA subunit
VSSGDLSANGFFGSERIEPLDPAIADLVDNFLDANPGDRERLIPLLQCVQDELGCLPLEAQELVADRLGMSPVQVTGVVTFYHLFTATPRAPIDIRVCAGTSCHVRDGNRVLDALESSLGVEVGGISVDGLFNLERVRCIGACGLAPVVMVNGEVQGSLTAGAARRLADELRRQGDHAESAARRRTITADVLSGFSRVSRRVMLGPATESPVHRSFQVCTGTGCLAAGARSVAEAFRRELHRRSPENAEVVELDRGVCAELGVTGCRGFCAAGPLVRIPELGVLYCGVRESDVSEIVQTAVSRDEVVDRLLYLDGRDGRRCRGQDDIPFFSRQHRSVLRLCGEVDPERIEQYEAHGGYAALRTVIHEMRPDQVIRAVSASGLQGRGGAGFPTGRKWLLVAEGADETKFVVCNGDEGDPGAFMDRSLMEGDPHSVLEGMAIAGFAVGAHQGFIYLRAEYELAVKRLLNAVAQARERGYLGHDILGSEFDFDVRLVQGAGAFVCGEETALLSSIEGRRGMPRPRPPSPAERGLWGQPTLINNVETFANIPSILAGGAADFASIGTADSRGSKTFALAGAVRNVGLVEVAMGTTLRQIVFDVGGGIHGDRSFKGACIGGPTGGCLNAEHLDTPMEYEALRELGAAIGSGGLVIVDDRTCMVRLARYFLEFCVEESCGKCPPCRIGTKVLLNILARICEGQGEAGDIDRLVELGEHIRRTSLCGLGQAAPSPVLTAIRHFRGEFEAHVVDRSCPAGECHRLADIVIDAELCDGCGSCVEVCPVDAIVGREGETHSVDLERCTHCGECLSSCPTDAVRTV